MKKARVFFIALLVLGCVVLLGVRGYDTWQEKRKADKTERAAARAARTQVTSAPAPAPKPEPPMKVSAVTPAEITADYAYSLEADGPIMVQYPGEKAFLFTPGPCQNLPRPRHSGPKKFWDPRDPEGGHIAFRIYRSDDGRC